MGIPERMVMMNAHDAAKGRKWIMVTSKLNFIILDKHGGKRAHE
jgi:hypothetical protein